MQTKKTLELLDVDIFVNEKYTGIKDEVGYDILFDHDKDQFIATLGLMNESTENAPKEIRWELTKKLKDFTEDEQMEILHYRGLKLTDGFFLADVFMQGENIKLIK